MKYATVTWIQIQTQFDQCLGWNKVLYAYFDSNGRIYYIGKADDQTLRQRLTDPDKASMVGILTRNGGQPGGILYGIINVGGNYSPASSVISNAEALLIREENPWGNIQKPRITEDIHITCSGTWRGKQNLYQQQGLSRIPTFPLARPFPEVPIKRIARTSNVQQDNPGLSEYLRAIDTWKNFGLGLNLPPRAGIKKS